MFFFTADEHYGHANIIKFCNRPFSSVEEMDKEMMKRHNDVVTGNDTVIHIGDFSLLSRNFDDVQREYIRKLNGSHIFIPGSHDQWMQKGFGNRSHIWQKSINGQQIICCHYPMARWPASHWNSWHLFGHMHGRYENHGKSYDVGVDINDFTPVSFSDIEKIMAMKDDNQDLIRK